jgi:hypothetical protein
MTDEKRISRHHFKTVRLIPNSSMQLLVVARGFLMLSNACGMRPFSICSTNADTTDQITDDDVGYELCNVTPHETESYYFFF